MEVSNKTLFWDVDTSQLNKDKHASFIIRRVLQFGDKTDWQWLAGIYDREIIRRCVSGNKFLDKKSLNFWQLVLK